MTAGEDKRDKLERTSGEERWDRTNRIWQIGQGNRDGTTVAGQSGYGIWDTTNETGQPGQVNVDRKEEKTVEKVYPGWEQRTRLPEQDSMDRTARKGQGDRTTVAGQLAEDIWDRTAQI